MRNFITYYPISIIMIIANKGKSETLLDDKLC